MPLLDRFRSRPEWQHRDAEVRAAAVRRLAPEQQELLLAIARDDSDVRVRRLAVKKLTSPSALRVVAQGDVDDSIREDASEILLRLALESAEASIALAALDGLSETRHFQAVARSGRCEEARHQALDRLKDPRALSPVARGAEDPAIRMAALEALNDESLLGDVALRSEHRDVAVAATARINDRAMLEAVSARARNKAAARQARAALEAREVPMAPSLDQEHLEEAHRSGEDRAPATEMDHGEALTERAEPLQAEPLQTAVSPADDETEALAARVSLCEALEALAGEVGLAGLEEIRAAWDDLVGVTSPATDALAARFEDASRRYLARCEEWRGRATLRSRREELCEAMERLAGSEDPAATRAAAGVARESWLTLQASGPMDPDLLERFLGAEQALAEGEARRREEGVRERRDNLARLKALCDKAESLARSPTPTLRETRLIMGELKSALQNPGPVPGRRERQAVLARLRAARGALFPRAQELREADEWTRWSNLSRQEDLCRRAEALVGDDPLEASRRMRELEAEWNEARQSPRGQGDALWNRFKAARDEVRQRCETQLAEKAHEAEANLRKKEGLCAQAEALADSTEWLKTAEILHQLQEEWKRTGVVPKGSGAALWNRFRAACDRFFERRKHDLARRRREWAQNLKSKEVLCEKAEALAQSTDWEPAAAEVRRLQAEWKQIGPVRKNRSEAVWLRFRGACGAFFERYRRRDEVDRAAQLADREALIQKLEEIGRLEEAVGLGEQVRSILAGWHQVGRPPQDETLEERFLRARDHVIETHPEAFRGTELDPDANRARMEKLCARIEALLPPEDVHDATSLVDRLREALAANTMGARADSESRWRSSAAEVAAAQQAWKRLGPVPGAAGRALKERFDRACQRFFAQKPQRAWT